MFADVHYSQFTEHSERYELVEERDYSDIYYDKKTDKLFRVEWAFARNDDDVAVIDLEEEAAFNRGEVLWNLPCNW